MEENYQFNFPKNNSNYIKVIGVGGGGCNAVNFMYNEGIKGVDYVVCNTDAQALEYSPISNRIQLGDDLLESLTKVFFLYVYGCICDNSRLLLLSRLSRA